MSAPTSGTGNPAQVQAANPLASVWVSASAGSGKTKVLADRVLRLLLTGTEPERILCLTFTRAGAAEMRNRIHALLGGWAIADERQLTTEIEGLTGKMPGKATLDRARRLFVEILDTPGGLKIQTIHAFCESLLGRFPIEAGVAPHFEVMDARSAREVLETLRFEILSQNWRTGSDRLSCAIRTITDWVTEDEFDRLMQEIVNNRSRIQRILMRHLGKDPAIEAMRSALDVSGKPSCDDHLAASCQDDAFDVESLRRVAEDMQQGSDADRKRARLIGEWLQDPSGRIATFQNYGSVFLTTQHEVRATLATRQLGTEVESILRREAMRVRDVVTQCNALRIAEATEAVIDIAIELDRRYDRHKRQRAMLDFDDLILGARGLVERAAPWVLYKLDGGLDHILIDEAQDSNADQWAVVRALSEEFFTGDTAREATRTVFAVGDEKQSIFGFQGAAPDEFARMSRYFEDRCRDARQDWHRVPLDVSFRSTESVLTSVDTVFADEETCKGVSAAPIRHRAHRAGQGGLVEVWPPVMPFGETRVRSWPTPDELESGETPEQRLAHAIAEQISVWLAGNERLVSTGRPIRAGDIMILVRRRRAFVEYMIRELKLRNIEVAGVDRMVVGDQLAVRDLLAIAAFALLPEDDLNLAAVLKSPLIGFNEDQLFSVCHGRGKNSVWRRLRQSRAGSTQEAKRILKEVMGRADTTPPYEFFAHVLGSLGGRDRIVSALGDEANDPIDEFLALALSYQNTHAPSLEGFLHWFDRGQAEIARDLAQPVRDEVRVLTVHGAKGLQAPVVFLADTLQTPNQTSTLLWRDAETENRPLVLWVPRARLRGELTDAMMKDSARRQDEEYRRLLYVAMTRAEDRLYICGFGTRRSPPPGAWHNLIRRSLAATGTESFAFEAPVSDGRLGWQGEGLRLSNPQIVPLPPRAEITPLSGSIPPLPAWARASAPLEPVAKPVTSVTQRPPPKDHPGVFRGHLIHRLLELLPQLHETSRLAAAQRFLSRQGLDPETVAGYLDETIGVLEHPEFAPFFTQGSRAEVPVVGTIGQRRISGRIDRLVVTPEQVVIVDYKSDFPVPGGPEEVPVAYLRQLAAYRALLMPIYGPRTIDCVILWTAGPSLMPLDPDILVDHAP